MTAAILTKWQQNDLILHSHSGRQILYRDYYCRLRLTLQEIVSALPCSDTIRILIISPVLMILWMTRATCPLSKEFSSFTRSIRQVQRTSREAARRMRPTARSDRGESTNRCLPGQHMDQCTVKHWDTCHYIHWDFNDTPIHIHIHRLSTVSRVDFAVYWGILDPLSRQISWKSFLTPWW